jgi:hypothetical protein
MTHASRAIAAGFCALVTAGTLAANGRPKFYPDDPLKVDPETQDASGVDPWDINDGYDFIENTFLGAGETSDVRAVNVNTLDEVPDSSWFHNRLGMYGMTPDEVQQGSSEGTGPATGTLTIVGGKNEGISPGLTIRDKRGDIYFVKFDPPSNPEMATGAEVIATQLFHALGYHVPENYIAWLAPGDLRIEESAPIRGDDGKLRPFHQSDLRAVLAKAARAADGRYRVVMSKALPGTPLGPFRYHGTRPDDPNDIFPHEHRRELRGLRVFSAWLNHDDSRSINTLDTLVERDGRKLVWHHLIDFGSTLGSGSTAAQKPRAGNEYLWEARPTFVTMLTLGFYVRPWIKVKYPDLPAIGRIEADYFRPENWKPEYPNPAFDNMRADDAYWAARRMVPFTNELVHSAVKAGEYSDPEAESYLTQVLITRRDKILQHWLNGVLPIEDLQLSPEGALTFRNVAVEIKAAAPASEYRVRWFSFDNATGTAAPVGDESASADLRAQAPAALLGAAPAVVMAEIRGVNSRYPGWQTPLKVYFRRAGSAWETVGIERQ